VIVLQKLFPYKLRRLSTEFDQVDKTFICDKGDNGKYLLVFTDEKGEGHVVETEAFPFTITDGSGTTYEVTETGEVKVALNYEEKDNIGNNDNVNVEDNAIDAKNNHLFYVELNEDNITDGSSLTLVKNSLVKLNIMCNYNAVTIRVLNSQEKSFQKALTMPRPKINLDSIKWALLTPQQQNGIGATIQFTPEDTGIFKLEINPNDILSVLFTDTVTKKDTLISVKTYNETKITITLNIIDEGILYFKPKDNINYYKEYGFDDALIPQLQQANDYEKLNISGVDYYVPWLGILPKTDVEIKLEYKSHNQQNKSHILLESSSNELVFLTDVSRLAPVSTQTIRLRAEKSGTYVVKAYAILEGDIKKEIGRLKIESKEVIKKKVRIIRTKRRSEVDYISFTSEQKNALIKQVNEYYKQAFIEFELNLTNYQDTITIMTDSVISSSKNDVFEHLPNDQRTDEEYYIFICSRAIEQSTNGLGQLLGKLSIIYNNSAKTASHELGHNLGLQHTFDNNNDNTIGVCKVSNRTLDKYTTKNIMDYPQGQDNRFLFFLYQINYLK
jgi:predicted Zn-dependent protease